MANIKKDEEKRIGFMSRLPKPIKARLDATTERLGTSMNETLVWALDQSLDPLPAPATRPRRARAPAETHTTE